MNSEAIRVLLNEIIRRIVEVAQPVGALHTLCHRAQAGGGAVAAVRGTPVNPLVPPVSSLRQVVFVQPLWYNLCGSRMPQMRLWCLYSAQVAGHGTNEPWLPLLFAKRVDTRTEVARWTREWTDNRVGFPS